MKTNNDYIKAARKGSREAEIEMYGKPLNHNRVVKSKKQYDRKRVKANDKRHSPYFFLEETIRIYSKKRFTFAIEVQIV